MLCSVFAVMLAAAPCAPERCEADCVAGSAKACVASAAALQATEPLKAAAYLQRACTAEEGLACAELAGLFRTGKGVPLDADQARRLEGRACALKVGASCLALGRSEEKQAAAARTATDTQAAMGRAAAYLRAGCEARAAAACTELSRLHALGAGVSVDEALAVKLATQGCDGGDKAGCRYLAWFYEEGRGVRRDPKRAAELARQGVDARPLATPPVCEAEPALVAFESPGQPSELWVDGLLLGATPLVARLAPGPRVVLARAPGREPLRELLTLTRGQRAQRELTWPLPLSVTSTPSGAAVRLDGQPAGMTPLSTVVAAGMHTLEVSLEGFEPEQRAVNASGEKALVERFELRALPGVVQLVTTPPGAELLLDGQPLGVSPWSGPIAPGTHRLRAVLAQYVPVEKVLKVTKGERASLVLELKLDARLQPGRLRVDSEPPGASVAVDGADVGVTPWEGELAKGSHQLEVSLAGHAVERRTVSVGGQLAQLKVGLRALPREDDLPVTWAVRSVPSGATLTLDGKPMGRTPWTGRVARGTHEVALSLAGYEPWNEAAVAPGDVLANLAALPTGVRVVTVPLVSEATLLVNGAPMRAAQGVLELPPGKHLVEVQAPGYLPAKAVARVQQGQVGELSVPLRPAPPPPRQGVRVVSEPAGADVFLGELKVGVTPLEKVDLAAGAHRLRLSLAGFEPQEFAVEVLPKQVEERVVKLASVPASVALETSPRGARVFLDGDLRGDTPLMLKLGPGTYRAYVVLDGYETVDEQKVVVAGQPQTWSWTLKSTAPPPPLPPAVVASDALPAMGAADAGPSLEVRARALLADPVADEVAKRQALDELERSQRDLGPYLALTTPVELRRSQCVTRAPRVQQVKYRARASDSFGNEIPAVLVVNGQVFGALPFDGTLPACAETLAARDERGQVVSRTLEVPLDRQLRADEVFDFPGRRRRASITAFGEAAVPPLLLSLGMDPARGDLDTLNYGGGVRLDLWGQLIHLSVAVKASSMFRRSLYRDTNSPVMPLGDLFLGLTAAAGSDTVRYRFAFDVGVLSLVCPGVRLTHALSFGERLFVALTMDGAWVPPLFINRGSGIAGIEYGRSIVTGGTFGWGVGW